MFRFYCLALLRATNGRTTAPIEVEVAPEEPFTFIPRHLFEHYLLASAGNIDTNAIVRHTIACDRHRLRFDFDVGTPSGARQTLYLPVMLPETDRQADLLRNRVLLGNDVLERHRAEIAISYLDIFHHTTRPSVRHSGTSPVNQP